MFYSPYFMNIGCYPMMGCYNPFSYYTSPYIGFSYPGYCMPYCNPFLSYMPSTFSSAYMGAVMGSAIGSNMANLFMYA